MNCSEYQNWISRFIDQETSATDSSELFEHLGKCAECRGFLDALMKLNAELDRIQTADELEKAMSTQQYSFAGRRAVRGVVQQRSFRSRISTFALLIVVTMIVGFLLSVNVKMQTPPEAVPQELLRPQ